MIYPICRNLVTNYVLVQIFRMAPTRRGEQGNPEPPPPPSMAEVLMDIEVNRQHSERLLEQLVQQGARMNTECNNLNDFLQSVTAQNWYPKIWAKFSLFALHCIMAYLFKLLKLNKATHGKLKRRKQSFLNFQTKYCTQIGKTNCS